MYQKEPLCGLKLCPDEICELSLAVHHGHTKHSSCVRSRLPAFCLSSENVSLTCWFKGWQSLIDYWLGKGSWLQNYFERLRVDEAAETGDRRSDGRRPVSRPTLENHFEPFLPGKNVYPLVSESRMLFLAEAKELGLWKLVS